MAILRQRLRRKNANGTYDTVYFETLSNLVKMPDGTSLTSKINDMDTVINNKASLDHVHNNYAVNGHSHAASDITSGVLDAARIPTLDASKVGAGTFSTTNVVAATGTDYGTARVRNISAGTVDLTVGSSELTNGNMYVCYE